MWWGELLKVVLVAIVTAVVDYAINQQESIIRRFAWF